MIIVRQGIYWFVYSTEHPQYRDAALRLVAQGQKWGMAIENVAIENKKSWMANCMHRPQLLYQYSLTHLNEYIGLLDSDLDIISEPTMLKEEFKGDILGSYLGSNYAKDRQYSAGIVAFAPTELGHKVLEQWAIYCYDDGIDGESGYLLAEQYWLYKAITEVNPIMVQLPIKQYNKIVLPWDDFTSLPTARECSNVIVAHKYNHNKPADIDKRQEII